MTIETSASLDARKRGLVPSHPVLVTVATISRTRTAGVDAAAGRVADPSRRSVREAPGVARNRAGTEPRVAWARPAVRRAWRPSSGARGPGLRAATSHGRGAG